MSTTANEEWERAAAWSDYRKEYGVSAPAMTEAHKAFKAGWDAARADGPTDSVLR